MIEETYSIKFCNWVMLACFLLIHRVNLCHNFVNIKVIRFIHIKIVLDI